MHGNLWLSDDDLDLEFDNLFNETTSETEVTVSNIPWRDAYEANKTRSTCIVCGKKTKSTAVLASVVQTCTCVDELARRG